jgi:hypothetical protein
MYWTGLNPHSMKPVETAKKLRDRKVQRALLQFFAPENYFAVRQALESVGRTDLIGDGPQCLIASRAPREALEARRADASDSGGRASYRRPARTRGRRR